MVRPLRVRFGRGDAQRNRIPQDSVLIHSELAAHRLCVPKTQTRT